MNETAGFIKLYRSILDSRSYSNINTRILFIHFLLKANWKQGNFKGTFIERGELVTGITESLIEETGLSKQNIATALKKLEQCGSIEKKSKNKYTIIKIVNYDKYQSENTNIEGGFIALHKSILDHEIYDNNDEKLIFIHCLLKAQWNNENKFGIERGQLKTTTKKLVEETNIKSEQIITAINSLIEKGMIKIKYLDNSGLSGLIELCNYDKFQTNKIPKGYDYEGFPIYDDD